MKCFVIMPFADEFSDVYSTIKRAINESTGSEVDVQRLDDVKTPGKISDEIVEAIELSDFCVADLTGDNPNVMWEVGYATAKDKPVIFITQDEQRLPFDIRDMRTIPYNLTNLDTTLHNAIAESVRSMIHRSGQPSFGKRERVIFCKGSASPLRYIKDEGKIVRVRNVWDQSLDQVKIRIAEGEASIQADYILRKRREPPRMTGVLRGAGSVTGERLYLSYQIKDLDRGQGSSGVMELYVRQWGPIEGYYLSKTYRSNARTVLGRINLQLDSKNVET